MGDKLTGLKAQLERMKKDDPIVRMFVRGVELTTPPFYIPDTDPVEYVLPTETLDIAEEVIRLRALDSMANKFAEAAKQYRKEVEQVLHEAMSSKGPTGFTTKSGWRFAMTSTSQIQAKAEEGGTGNPNLKQWLVDNGAPDVAEGTINANTLKSTLSTWLKDNPIEATKQVGDDQIPLGGEELLTALGISAEDFALRQAEHVRLVAMVNIAKEPAISVTKA